MTLPARTICVAAGTRPNVTYEHEYPGTFALDAAKAYFRAHRLVTGADGQRALEETPAHTDLGRDVGFLTSYAKDGRYVSFFGDTHPTYAGNVVKAMASAKDGYPSVVKLFAAELADLTPDEQPQREIARAALFERLDAALIARVRAVNRLTPTILEVVVHAPLAAAKFEPGQFYRL